MWKISKGLAKKWPEMVVTWIIVTHRLGELVFISLNVLWSWVFTQQVLETELKKPLHETRVGTSPFFLVNYIEHIPLDILLTALNTNEENFID